MVWSRAWGLLSARAIPTSLIALLALSGCASGGHAKGSAEGDADRYLRLAMVQMDRGQTQQALESARQAVERDPSSADAHRYLGLIYMSQSDLPHAEEELRQAIKLNPYLTDAHNELGVVYREEKEYDKALKEFQTALNDRNYHTPEKLQLNMGNLYMEQGVMSEAVRCFERAVALKPDYQLGYLSLGTAYKKMGKPDLAVQQFQKVISLAPDSPEATQARQFLSGTSGRSAP